MATMNVSLPKAMVAFIDDMVAGGEYSFSSEVVREALRLLRHEQAIEREKAAILVREVARGLDDAKAGRFSSRTVSQIAEDILRGAVER